MQRIQRELDTGVEDNDIVLKQGIDQITSETPSAILIGDQPFYSVSLEESSSESSSQESECFVNLKANMLSLSAVMGSAAFSAGFSGGAAALVLSIIPSHITSFESGFVGSILGVSSSIYNGLFSALTHLKLSHPTKPTDEYPRYALLSTIFNAFTFAPIGAILFSSADIPLTMANGAGFAAFVGGSSFLLNEYLHAKVLSTGIAEENKISNVGRKYFGLFPASLESSPTESSDLMPRPRPM